MKAGTATKSKAVKGKVTPKPAKKENKAPEYYAEASTFTPPGKNITVKMFNVVHEDNQRFPDVGLSLGKVKKLLEVPDIMAKLQAFADSEGESVE